MSVTSPAQLTAPIIVAAPTQRCGSTLIQRALNSTKRAIIYGENFYVVENYPAIVGGVQEEFEVKSDRTQRSREQLISGMYDQDLSALYPDYGAYADFMKIKLYEMLAFYAGESARYGFERWGLKNQVVKLNGFANFVRLVPAATYIVVYRDISEVIRSHKARFPDTLRTLDDYRAYGERWAAHYRALRTMRGPKCLHIEHSELVRDPDKWAAKIEGLCELPKIDRQVFRRKINVSPIVDTLTKEEAENRYRQPADLTPEEYAVVMSTAGDTAREFGYRT